MIKSFRHKGLGLFFETGSRKGVDPSHAQRLARILDRLDASISPQDMDLPGFKIHSLVGRQKGRWSVWVSGNWRVTFGFENQDAIQVDYEDYH